jgi:hypothetical protein
MLLALFVVTCLSHAAEEAPDTASAARVMSWNVSRDAFVSYPRQFQAMLNVASPDVLLLDEVHSSLAPEQLQAVMPPASSIDAGMSGWNISWGRSGGWQRGVIASRAPMEALAEFAGLIPYPDEATGLIAQGMSASERAKYVPRLDEGIAVNGAIVLLDERRLLVVIADLACCGDGPGSWEELQRRFEAMEIRKRVRQVLARVPVDGVVLSGDFNLVSTVVPLVLLSGPYDDPIAGLIAAELYHATGRQTWTWDGRGTQYPSRMLDAQLYSPASLTVSDGFILDTEDMSPEELTENTLAPDDSKTLSDHRPLVVEYRWR